MDLKFGYLVVGLIFSVGAFLNFRKSSRETIDKNRSQLRTVAILNLCSGLIFLGLGLARLLKP